MKTLRHEVKSNLLRELNLVRYCLEVNMEEESTIKLQAIRTKSNKNLETSGETIILDETNWKKNSKLWPILQILSFTAALIFSVYIPTKQLVKLQPYRILLIVIIGFFIARNTISLFSNKIKAVNNHQAQFYFAVGMILILWDGLTTKSNFLQLPFFPSLGQILQVMVEDAYTLLISTAFSMRLLILGFTIGTILGLVSGVLIGWFREWNYWLFPVIKVMGVIPATAWIPISMFIFPSSFYAQIFLIVLCVWFPVAYMTSGGIVNIQKSYFEAARTLGADEKFLIFKIAIPGAMPSIFTGVYTATGISFATLVVSEIIGAKAGLGWYINWAKSWSNYAKVYASIIVMAIVFSIVMSIIFKIRDRVLIWQKGLLK
jgi:NitT/TauT family transport system permease protein